MNALQIYPALDRPTEAALRASIEHFGVIVPVVVDQNGEILDGHHRSRIAEQLGLDYPTQTRVVANTEEAYAIARTLNQDRRMLTREQRLPVVMALRQDGHSYRAIGGALKIDEKTIRTDVKEATADMSAVQPERIIGLDGKSRPSTRQPADGRDRPGTRKDRTKPFVINSPRQAELAKGQLRRLVLGLSEINGLVRGLKNVDYQMAGAVCEPGEMAEWAVMAGKLSTALRTLKTELEGVCHAPEAQQDHLHTGN